MREQREIPQIAYWLWLTTREGVGLGDQHRLLQVFGSAERTYYAHQDQIEELRFLSDQGRASLMDKSWDRVRQIMLDCRRLGVRMYYYGSKGYPVRLKHIYQPPLVLYERGVHLEYDRLPIIAMAGTRRCTDYGWKMSGQLAGEITRQGGVVATGVVPGCDYAAAVGALKANGPVICVLAGGVDVSFDKNSPDLYEAVCTNGTLVSEYPPGTFPSGRNFPVRNRILTGLSLGVVCVECGIRSGTMKVADLALEQGKDVYVVPTNVDNPQGGGTLELLKRGAAPVCTGGDVMENYRNRYAARLPRVELRPVKELPEKALTKKKRENSPKKEQKKEKTTQNPVDNRENKDYIDLDKQQDAYNREERAILLALQKGAGTVDDLALETDLPARNILSTLTLLTIRQLVQEENGGRYRLLVNVKSE